MERAQKMPGQLRPKLYPVGWEQLHRDSKALAWRLMDKGPFEALVAVTKGGLVPAAIVARELDVKLIDTFCVTSYDYDQRKNLATILKAPALAGVNGSKVLVIDDLVDTGRTARIIRETLPEAVFATVYAKPEGRPLVDVFITEVSQDTWILFPWDAEPTYAKPLVQSGRDE